MRTFFILNTHKFVLSTNLSWTKTPFSRRNDLKLSLSPQFSHLGVDCLLTDSFKHLLWYHLESQHGSSTDETGWNIPIALSQMLHNSLSVWIVDRSIWWWRWQCDRYFPKNWFKQLCCNPQAKWNDFLHDFLSQPIEAPFSLQ